MAVPKKRTSHARQARRRAHWKATVPTLSTCSNCGHKKLAHTVCSHCGYHNGVYYQADFVEHQGHDHAH